MAYRNIIINSVPKSGTYLLTQLIRALGAYSLPGELHFNDQHYSTGNDRKGALKVIKRHAPESLSALQANQAAPAHLTWSHALENALLNQNTGMFFMYRDPRDIMISYAKFATYSEIYRRQTKGHKQYYEFLMTLPNDQRRTEHVLRHRLFLFQFFENAPWLLSPAAIPISFETLYSDIAALREGKVGTTIQMILTKLGMAQLSCKPVDLFSQVFNKGKTAMGEKASNHHDFFDEGLRYAAENSQFRTIMRLYGYH